MAIDPRDLLAGRPIDERVFKPCAKCGSETAPRWSPRGLYCSNSHPDREHFDVICSRCGYVGWEEIRAGATDGE